jgi:DNA-binding IclR family transcriptional regulator
MLDSLTGHVGGQIPMGVGPASQAILAFLPEEEAEAIIEANAPLFRRYNGLTAAKVRGQLPQVRAQRYALDDGDLVAGISALAVPILPQGRDAIASIAINMTSARLQKERVGDLIELLHRHIAGVEKTINPLEDSVPSR